MADGEAQATDAVQAGKRGPSITGAADRERARERERRIGGFFVKRVIEWFSFLGIMILPDLGQVKFLFLSW